MCAFSYLAVLRILYRDLKPENLMLTDRGQLKVIDLGFCKMLAHERTFTFCGTVSEIRPTPCLNAADDPPKPLLLRLSDPIASLALSLSFSC